MSAPHCPACAAFDRWVDTLVHRGVHVDLPGDADLAERVGYSYASTLVHRTNNVTADVIAARRAGVCSAFRSALLDNASYRMTVLTCDMTPATEQGAAAVRDRARSLLVEGALDQLAIHLVESGVVPSLRL